MGATPSHHAKYRDVRRVLVVTLFLNWLVAAAKLFIGQTTHTLAMVADGYHSLLDGSSNVVGLVAIFFAYKPADDDHQYGHRKYETVSAMAISIALFGAAYRILSEAVHRMGNPVEPEVGVVNFAVMIVTIAVNLGVSTYERREGERLKSQLLVSDAAHTSSDVYASLAVIASLIAARLGFGALDIVFSVVIAVIILRIGYRIVRQGLSVISDQIMLDPHEVETMVASIAGVLGCARVRTRGTEDHVFMDLVCFVPGEMTMRDAHRLADHIEERIQEAFPAVRDIVVHLEPIAAAQIAPIGP